MSIMGGGGRSGHSAGGGDDDGSGGASAGGDDDCNNILYIYIYIHQKPYSQSKPISRAWSE